MSVLKPVTCSWQTGPFPVHPSVGWGANTATKATRWREILCHLAPLLSRVQCTDIVVVLSPPPVSYPRCGIFGYFMAMLHTGGNHLPESPAMRAPCSTRESGLACWACQQSTLAQWLLLCFPRHISLMLSAPISQDTFSTYHLSLKCSSRS